MITSRMLHKLVKKNATCSCFGANCQTSIHTMSDKGVIGIILNLDGKNFTCHMQIKYFPQTTDLKAIEQGYQA